jgi:AAA15 family ATPase/GTPase
VIIDFSVTNFKSFHSEQLFSMNVEKGLSSLQSNFCEVEGGKYSILKSAAIFGPNASGKSNLFAAFSALKWLISNSKALDEGDPIPTYEPFKLSPENKGQPIEFSIEFVVPTGIRYQYSVSFAKSRIISESLYSYPKRTRALVFSRAEEDTWETVKFGAGYKGGVRRFSFFPNNTYVSRAGNDASAPDSIRDIVRYFRAITIIDAGVSMHVSNYYQREGHLQAVANLICLADTGVKKITSEERSVDEILFPDNMPEEMKRAIQERNKISYKFWHEDRSGELVALEQDEISDGTTKLFEILPVLLTAISNGSPIFVDELDGHLHTSLVALIFDLFNDPLANPLNSQLIVTTHDTNMMDSNKLRRDQIWLVAKEHGATVMTSLDEFDKGVVRSNSPFEDFYKDGRLGALPTIPYMKIRKAVMSMPKNIGLIKSGDPYASD